LLKLDDVDLFFKKWDSNLMRKFAFTFIIMTLAASSAFANKIPKGVFRLSEIETAQAEAAEEETTVAYFMFPEKIKPS